MSPVPRRIVQCAVSSVLLAASFAAPASADPAIAIERYYKSYAEPASPAELAPERYYSSYGKPEPLSSAGSSEYEPVWPYVLVAVMGASAVAAAARRHTALRRRRSVAA